MTLAIVSQLRWRRSNKRISQEAAKLLAESGDFAFLRAYKLARRSHGAGDDCQARFWQAVCSEVGRQIQRTSVVADFLPRSMIFAQGGFAAGALRRPTRLASVRPRRPDGGGSRAEILALPSAIDL